jgi:hypothetical protein
LHQFSFSKVLDQLELANVFTILSFAVLRVWQFLGKHFLLIMVMVDPESNKTFNSLLDLTADIVSTTIIVIGVRLL